MDKKDITLATIGLFCLVAAIYSMGTIGQLTGFVVAFILTIFAIICFSYIITPKIGASFGCFVYTPREYLKKAPEKIAPIKGMIIQAKYPAAIVALNKILELNPYDPQPYLMLVEIYMDRLNDNNQAAELIEKYFWNPKLKVFQENVEMLMRYSDICLEQNCLEPAIALFKSELNAKGYSEPERKSLDLRLKALLIYQSKISPIIAKDEN